MNKKGRGFIVIGLLLLAAAAGLTAYNIVRSRMAQSDTENIMEQLLPVVEENSQRLKAEKKYPDYIRNPDMDMPVITVDSAECIGYLEIPALSVELPICSEWSYDNLYHAPCRYFGSVYLNNMIICGHNYIAHFGPLRRLSIGDKVIFTDTRGNRFNYRIAEFLTLEATDIEEMKSGNYGLTLFTCTLGGVSRIVLRCEKEEK
ncbi:MAG: sortase [Clostridia bacterium]|nr:sortase [Clostridia bacterium]